MNNVKDKFAEAINPSVGRSFTKLVLGTIAGLVASELVNHTVDAIANRRANSTTTETTEG